MSNLARTVRPGPPTARPKVLLVRQPIKSVRTSDEPDRAGLRLAYGIVITLGILGALWLIGYLGFRMGFAPLVRVPDLMVEGAAGLAIGAAMLISIPQTILEAGIEQPLWLMIGFALIAIPAGILGAIKPVSPGGPRPKVEVVVLSYAGAIAAILNASAVVWWSVSSVRATLIRELPFDPAEATRWLLDLQLAAGMDVLATIAAALWVVVAMRLNIPSWLRGLSASACFFSVAVIATAMAMSNVTVSQVTASRSIYFLDDGSLDTQLVLGHTPRSMASLRGDQRAALVELRDRPQSITIIGRESILAYLNARALPEE